MSDTLVTMLLDLLRPELERLVGELVAERLAAFTPSQPDPWLDVSEASGYLHLTPEALRARIRCGTIPAHWDGCRWLLDRRELEQHLRANGARKAAGGAATMTVGHRQLMAPRRWNGRGRGSKEEPLEAE
jgi:hypothetical protein